MAKIEKYYKIKIRQRIAFWGETGPGQTMPLYINMDKSDLSDALRRKMAADSFQERRST